MSDDESDATCNYQE